MKIYLLSGKTGTGKTTRLTSWVNENKNRTHFSGLLSPVINGKRFFQPVAGGTLIPMEKNVESDQVVIGRYSFSKKSFDKAKEIIRQSSLDNSEWLIIDEFGRLELQDQGLNPVISEIITSQIKKNVIIVVRDALINDFLNKYRLNKSDYELFNFQSLKRNAFILAGGKSSRMGEDKALLKLGKETILELLIKQFKKYFFSVSVIGNNDYSYNGIKSIPDILTGSGPLSGILTSLSITDKKENVIATSDMLLLPDELMNEFAFTEFNSDAVMFLHKDFIHPFPGIYPTRLKESFFNHLSVSENKKMKIYDLVYSAGSLQVIDSSVYSFIKENSFLNMNTPEDYQLVLKELIFKI